MKEFCSNYADNKAIARISKGKNQHVKRQKKRLFENSPFLKKVLHKLGMEKKTLMSIVFFAVKVTVNRSFTYE